MGVTTRNDYDYLHVTPGRLRVRSVVLKRDVARASRVEQGLATLPGLDLVRVNAVTGSVLVHYDTRQWTADSLLSAMGELEYLTPRPVRNRAPVSQRMERDAFTECCAIIGKELLGAAISRIFPNPIVTTLLAIV
jgi:hypothetical protein